jgi:hypothetical protein
VNPGALQSSITTSQNALADARTKLSARLASIEAAHAKYAYFKPFNLDALFRDMNSKLPRITVVENSAWAWAGGAAAQWHYTTNSLAFNGTIAQAADPTLLHELTHMLDDLHGWYLNGNLRPDMRKVEGLGYAVQHIFDNIFMLQRFEDGFAKGTYKSCKDISDAWHAAWLQIGSYGNTNVWTGGNDRGPLTSADITDFENRTAVNISHDAVYDTYAKMASAYAQMNFSCSYSLPRESVKKEIQ